MLKILFWVSLSHNLSVLGPRDDWDFLIMSQNILHPFNCVKSYFDTRLILQKSLLITRIFFRTLPTSWIRFSNLD
jgi:hypothetical protein